MAKEKLRLVVWTRQQGVCYWCGFKLPEMWALHHRKLLSRGGNWETENLLALHHECHNLSTDSVHSNPKKAKELGFMVSSWDNPSACLVTLIDGTTVTLTNVSDLS